MLFLTVSLKRYNEKSTVCWYQHTKNCIPKIVCLFLYFAITGIPYCFTAAHSGSGFSIFVFESPFTMAMCHEL
jgi:hypothetical protein